MSESTSNILRTRTLAWDSGLTDANGNPIVNINRSGHITSNDPSDTSRARHASAYSVNLVKTQVDTLNSGLTNRITSVVNEKIANGEIATGGSSGGSDVAVVGTPKISGQYAIIGASTDFNVSAYAGLQDAYIASFKCSLTGCADQTVTATNNSATVSFTIDNGVTAGTGLTMTVIAYDNSGNASHAATATITATNSAVAAPTITTPASGDVIVYNEGFSVQGTPFALMGAGSDTHSASRVLIRNHTTGAIVKTINLSAATVCELQASDLQNLGHAHQYDVSLVYQGTNLGWGVESLPVTVTLNSAIRAPVIVEPAAGASFFYVGTLVVRCLPFTCDFLADTFVKRTYQLRDQYDNVLVTREVANEDRYAFGDLTGIVGVGSVRLYVKDTGTRFGDSEWYGPVQLTSQPTSELISTLLVPTEGATLGSLSGVTCQLDDPPVTGGASALASTDFQICSGNDGSGILLSASESGQAHTFTAVESEAKLVHGSSYYARGRHHLTNGEATGWDTVMFNFRAGYVTPSGRLIQVDNAHESLILTGTYEGNAHRLLIPFAKYRKRQDTKWANSRTLVSNLYQHSSWATNFTDGNRYIYRQKDADGVPQFIAGDAGTLSCGSEVKLGPLTDDQLDAWAKPMFEHENKTARECTDIIIAQFTAANAPAAAYARSLTNLYAGGFDLPLLRDALAIYVEGDYLDALDPTVADYPAFALGKYGSNTRWMNGGYVWSCQQYTTNNALCVSYGGRAHYNYKDTAYLVVPVREI